MRKFTKAVSEICEIVFVGISESGIEGYVKSLINQAVVSTFSIVGDKGEIQYERESFVADTEKQRIKKMVILLSLFASHAIERKLAEKEIEDYTSLFVNVGTPSPDNYSGFKPRCVSIRAVHADGSPLLPVDRDWLQAHVAGFPGVDIRLLGHLSKRMLYAGIPLTFDQIKHLFSNQQEFNGRFARMRIAFYDYLDKRVQEGLEVEHAKKNK